MPAFSQGRDQDRKHVQPIIEIAREFITRNHLGNVAMSGGHNADVGSMCTAASQTFVSRVRSEPTLRQGFRAEPEPSDLLGLRRRSTVQPRGQGPLLWGSIVRQVRVLPSPASDGQEDGSAWRVGMKLRYSLTDECNRGYEPQQKKADARPTASEG